MLRAFSFYLTLFLILIFILAIPNQALADEHPEIKKFCMWKASAAQVIAMNRDIGLNETEVTDQFLNQQTAYNEQVIILDLIDKVYRNYEFETHDAIYSQTNRICLSNYIDESNEVFLSQQLDNDY